MPGCVGGAASSGTGFGLVDGGSMALLGAAGTDLVLVWDFVVIVSVVASRTTRRSVTVVMVIVSTTYRWLTRGATFKGCGAGRMATLFFESASRLFATETTTGGYRPRSVAAHRE